MAEGWYAPGMDLSGKVVVVTGAGTGVGRALAVGFSKRGAKVAGIARTEADLEATRARCDVFEPVVGDVSVAEDVERLFARAEAELGPVDVLINNAAVYPKVPFLEQPMEDFERALLINVMGVARCCRRALPGMIARGFGRVVNVGSYAFVQPIPSASVYSASKGAVSALTRAIAAEVTHPDVRVNEHMPGIFRTRMTPDEGEDPNRAFEYTLPVVSVPRDGPHGQTFLKGELQVADEGGLKSKVKGLAKRFLGG